MPYTKIEDFFGRCADAMSDDVPIWGTPEDQEWLGCAVDDLKELRAELTATKKKIVELEANFKQFRIDVSDGFDCLPIHRKPRMLP